jgi:hypothetical protein
MRIRASPHHRPIGGSRLRRGSGRRRHLQCHAYITSGAQQTKPAACHHRLLLTHRIRTLPLRITTDAAVRRNKWGPVPGHNAGCGHEGRERSLSRAGLYPGGASCVRLRPGPFWTKYTVNSVMNAMALMSNQTKTTSPMIATTW